jgi:MarR family transcriptional regulator, organic hydroperoxide resistance regulator
MARESARKSAAKAARKPGRQLGEAGVIAVLRLANRMTLDLASLLKPHGLTVSQYNALRILRGAEDGVTCGQLAERMLTRDPDITRLIDRLERAGLAARQRDAADRRVVTTRITPAGLAALAGLDAEVGEFDRGLFARVDDARLGQLVEILQEVLG